MGDGKIRSKHLERPGVWSERKAWVMGGASLGRSRMGARIRGLGLALGRHIKVMQNNMQMNNSFGLEQSVAPQPPSERERWRA